MISKVMLQRMIDKNGAYAPQRGVGVKVRLRAKQDPDWRLSNRLSHATTTRVCSFLSKWKLLQPLAAPGTIQLKMAINRILRIRDT